jgi:hypothetical protein
MTPFSAAELALAWPEIYLTGAICLVLLFDLFFAGKEGGRTATFTLAVLLVGAVICWRQNIDSRTVIFHGLYVADPVASLLKCSAFVFTAMALFYSRHYLARRGLLKGEFYVLTLTALLGVLVMASAPFSASVATSSDRRAVSLAFDCTLSIETSISFIEELVSSAVSDSASTFFATSRIEYAISSIEETVSRTLVASSPMF